MKQAIAGEKKEQSHKRQREETRQITIEDEIIDNDRRRKTRSKASEEEGKWERKLSR